MTIVESRPTVTCYGCKPGEHETGWHEVRCKKCLQVEMEELKHFFERYDDWFEAYQKYREEKNVVS